MEESPILILLTGGKSTRMGSSKGLLNYHGILWVLEQISRYKLIRKPKVYIGLGFDNKLYFEAIPWLTEALDDFYLYDGVEVKVVINKQPEFGAFSTLQTVLKKVEINASVLIQPIDVPLAYDQSLAIIINENNSVVIPNCNSKNGHPVKLKSEFWNTLLSIDKSSKEARLDLQIKSTKSSSITYIQVTDNSVYQNINTKVDWNNYLNKNN